MTKRICVTVAAVFFAGMAIADELNIGNENQSLTLPEMPSEVGFVGCCRTNSGQWCCYVGGKTCSCSVREDAEAVLNGTFSGDSFADTFEQMMDALREAE